MPNGTPSVPPFVLSDEHEIRIRGAATTMLRRSLAILKREHVVPRSRYRPWIQMARDYYGHAVERGDGPLADALQQALPERFQTQKINSIDLPWLYDAALVEAAVAAATSAHEPYEITSPSIEKTIDEFIEKLQAVPRSTVLEVVADVDVASPDVLEGDQGQLGNAIEIAGVRIIQVGNEPERFIERELPSAGFDVERSTVLVHPGPASLLVATVEALADSETRVVEARRKVELLVAAIRLSTASTAHSVVDIAGDPDRVRWHRPIITPLPQWGFRFAHRPIALSEADVSGLVNLIATLESLEGNDQWIPARAALSRLGRSLAGWSQNIVDQVIDLAIGMEAMLGGNDRTDIALRLRTRAASILATQNDPPDTIYRDVKTLYDLRSTYVHGASGSEKDVTKKIRSVTGVGRARWPAEQYLLALDRWRDLLRRAILARIALDEADIPWLVSSKKPFDVDQYLVAETNRDRWRQHIQRFWADRELAHAPLPPRAAQLTLTTPANNLPGASS